MAKTKEPTRMLVDDEQVESVQDTKTEPVLSTTNLEPGYVEIALKSGQGKTVIVPKSMMKYYSDETWVIVAENTKKK